MVTFKTSTINRPHAKGDIPVANFMEAIQLKGPAQTTAVHPGDCFGPNILLLEMISLVEFL